jgi:hypothetical protein
MNEYPDKGWGLSENRREAMKADMRKSLDEKNS